MKKARKRFSKLWTEQETEEQRKNKENSATFSLVFSWMANWRRATTRSSNFGALNTVDPNSVCSVLVALLWWNVWRRQRILLLASFFVSFCASRSLVLFVGRCASWAILRLELVCILSNKLLCWKFSSFASAVVIKQNSLSSGDKNQQVSLSSVCFGSSIVRTSSSVTCASSWLNNVCNNNRLGRLAAVTSDDK